MKKAIIIILSSLISVSALAKVDFFGGVEYGLGLSNIDKNNEEFNKGTLLGGKILGSLNKESYLIDLGVGFTNYKQDNDLLAGPFQKVELESDTTYIHLSPKLKLTDHVHLGVFYDYHLNRGILLSQDGTSVNSVGGVNLTYQEEHLYIPLRVGVSYETGLEFGREATHSVAKVFFQIGFPWGRDKKVETMAQPAKEVKFVASNFAFDSYKLPVYNLMKITALARILKDNEDWELVIVEGHTDSVGENKYNINLSKLRADSAFQIFKQEGLPESKIRLVYKGESELMVNENSTKDREANRRIEIEIRSQDQKLLEDVRSLFESK